MRGNVDVHIDYKQIGLQQKTRKDKANDSDSTNWAEKAGKRKNFTTEVTEINIFFVNVFFRELFNRNYIKKY